MLDLAPHMLENLVHRMGLVVAWVAGRNGERKDVVIQPGTDPSVLELRFAGADRINVESVGTLLIVNKDGSVWRYKPDVYQLVDGKRKSKIFAFHFIGKDRVSLKIEKLNPSAPVVVGPVNGSNGIS
jgi:hypothetical protein